MFLIPIEVECYAGQKASEAPRAFKWLDKRVEASAILDRWYEGGVDPSRPTEDYFKIQGDDGETYLLKHLRSTDEWHLCVKID